MEDLPNIGPKLAAGLRAAGITAPEELVATGSIAAWRRLADFHCLHSLTALEGAIWGIVKAELDDDTRRRLQAVGRSSRTGPDEAAD